MDRSAFTLALLLAAVATHAQWAGAGLFSVFDHFQACAFHQVDTGAVVYGTDNPNSGEGGIIKTWDGMAGGGGYVWYQSGYNIEDIDVKVVNGFPYYMAAGHSGYASSHALVPYILHINPFQFDDIYTGSSQYYRTIRMRNDLVAFAGGGNYLGHGIIDMGTDTGYTWTNVAVLTGQPVSRLHFVNDTLAFAATGGYRRLIGNGVLMPDSGAVYRSIDGGMNWQQVHSDTLTGFSDVAFSSALTGVTTRNDGAILRTADGGDSWTPATVNLADTVVMTAVTFRQDGVGFAAAYRSDGVSGYILISYDDGQTWYENFSTSGMSNPRRLYDLYFFDGAHGYASGHIRPLRTTGIVTHVPEPHTEGLTLFPNPAQDEVVVRLSSANDAFVEVMDATGRVVRSARGQGPSLVIDVRDLRPGSYLVRATVNGTMQLARLVRM